LSAHSNLIAQHQESSNNELIFVWKGVDILVFIAEN